MGASLAIREAARGALVGEALPRRLRLLVLLLVVEVYAATFVPLYDLAGNGALNVFSLVTAIAGGLMGVRGGLFVALVGLLIQALPFGVLVDVDPDLFTPIAAVTYALAIVASGVGFGLMSDWRSRALSHDRLAVGPEQLRSATSGLPLVVFTLDRSGIFTLAEGRGLQRIGRRRGEAVGTSIFERYAGRADIHEHVRRALAGEVVTATVAVANAAFETTFAPLRNPAGLVDGVLGVGVDVTERRQGRRDMRDMEDATQRDPLTGLPNRVGLVHRLDAALARARGETALLILDLDRFGDVNESVGHAAGDELLRAVGERIFEHLGVTGQAARLGGDEFAVAMPDTDERGATVLARRLSDAIRAPFTIGTHELFVGASIGIALAPRDGHDSTTLMRKADVAMYAAKRGHVGWTAYAPAPDEPSPALLSLASDLRHAIERDELALAFQPIVGCDTGRLQRFEALARWPRRDRDVGPAEFVPLADRVGLLTSLTDWVVAAGVRQLHVWLAAGLDARLSVNLSPRNLLEPDLPKRIASALQASGVPGSRFGIEVTETTLMADPERAARTIAELRELGVSIATCDFGAGYSSLAYLHRLPISTVKIDRAFIKTLPTDANARAIVRATVELAHALDLTVVAEGVEDAGTLDLVRDLGCDQAQGYHIARPLAPADALRWLRA